MLRRLSPALAAAVLLAAANAAVAIPPPETIELPASVGDIRFPHRAHFTLPRKCWSCHREGERPGKIISQPAARAPTVNTFAPGAPLRDQAHSLCLECHRAVKQEKATTRCYGCHQRREPKPPPAMSASTSPPAPADAPAKPPATTATTPGAAPPAAAPAEVPAVAVDATAR